MSSTFTRALPSSLSEYAKTLSLWLKLENALRVTSTCLSRRRNAQELRVRVRVDVSAGFAVEELAEVVGVDEVAVDADGQAKGRVDVERLRFGSTLLYQHLLEASIE